MKRSTSRVAPARPGQASAAAPDGPARLRGLLAAALMVVLTLAAHGSALTGGALWDDDYWTINNPVLNAGGAPLGYWTTTQTWDYLPVTATFFWLQRELWGQHWLGYRVVNLGLHLAAALLLWRLLRRLAVPGAYLAALIFAVHPVTVASADWISEQKNTLSMVLMLWALLAYLRFEDRPRAAWYTGAVVLFALALLVKGSVVVAPAMLLGLAWWRRGRIARADLLRSLPFWALAATGAALTVLYQHGYVLGQSIYDPTNERVLLPIDPPADALERAVLIARAVWFYLSKALLPINLAAIYPRWDVHAIDAWGVTALAALAAAMAGLLIFARRRQVRPLTFALGYYFVALLPVLGLVNTIFMLYSFVADHWHYLALPGPIALLVGVAWHHLSRRGPAVRKAGLALAGAVVAMLAGATHAYARVYRGQLPLWEHTVAMNPDSLTARTYLAQALEDAGRIEDSLAEHRRILALKPGLAHSHHQLGKLYLRRGRLEEAAGQFRTALALQGNYHPARLNLASCLHNLGVAHARREEFAAARPCFIEAAALMPEEPEYHLALGRVLIALGRPDQAAPALERALQLHPRWDEAHFHLGTALADQGQWAQAAEQFRRVLALRPGDAAATQCLSRALARMGGHSSVPPAPPGRLAPTGLENRP